MRKIKPKDLFGLANPEIDEWSAVPAGDNPPAWTVSLKSKGERMIDKVMKFLGGGEPNLQKSTQLFIATAVATEGNEGAKKELVKAAHALAKHVQDEELQKNLEAFDEETTADAVESAIEALTKAPSEPEPEDEGQCEGTAAEEEVEDEAEGEKEDAVSKSEFEAMRAQIEGMQKELAASKAEKDMAIAKSRLNKAAQAPGSDLDAKARILVTLEKHDPEAAKLFLEQNESDGLRVSTMQKMNMIGYDVDPLEKAADDAIEARIAEMTKGSDLTHTEAVAKLMNDPEEVKKLLAAEARGEV